MLLQRHLPFPKCLHHEWVHFQLQFSTCHNWVARATVVWIDRYDHQLLAWNVLATTPKLANHIAYLFSSGAGPHNRQWPKVSAQHLDIARLWASGIQRPAVDPQLLHHQQQPAPLLHWVQPNQGRFVPSDLFQATSTARYLWLRRLSASEGSSSSSVKVAARGSANNGCEWSFTVTWGIPSLWTTCSSHQIFEAPHSSPALQTSLLPKPPGFRYRFSSKFKSNAHAQCLDRTLHIPPGWSKTWRCAWLLQLLCYRKELRTTRPLINVTSDFIWFLVFGKIPKICISKIRKPHWWL